MDRIIRSIVLTGWWFQTFFIFTPTWGNDPIWRIFFRWVETTNQVRLAQLQRFSCRFCHIFWLASLCPDRHSERTAQEVEFKVLPCFMPQQHPLWLVGALPGGERALFLRQIQLDHNRFLMKVYAIELGDSKNVVKVVENRCFLKPKSSDDRNVRK